MDLNAIVEHLTGLYPDLTPQVRKAAKYVLENPARVATQSMRQLASGAGVPPPTMVRLAKAVGFETWNELRGVYQSDYHRLSSGFPDRARQLQIQARADGQQPLWPNLADAASNNLAELVRITPVDDLISAANILTKARRVFVMGVLSSFSFAHYCYYIAQMALPNWQLLPANGGMIADHLTDIAEQDVLIAIAFPPYGRSTVDAVRFATKRKARIIAITDSPVAPVARKCANVFVTPTASPHYFSSFIATTALIEALVAYVIAQGGDRLVENIAQIERIRGDLKEYWVED